MVLRQNSAGSMLSPPFSSSQALQRTSSARDFPRDVPSRQSSAAFSTGSQGSWRITECADSRHLSPLPRPMAFDFSASTQALSKEQEVIEADEEEEEASSQPLLQTRADATEAQAVNTEEDIDDEPLSAKLPPGARSQAYSNRFHSDPGARVASDAVAGIPEIVINGEVLSAGVTTEGLLDPSYDTPTAQAQGRSAEGSGLRADSPSARTATPTPDESLQHSCVRLDRSPWQWPEDEDNVPPELPEMLQMPGRLSTASLVPSAPPWSLDASAIGPENGR